MLISTHYVLLYLNDTTSYVLSFNHYTVPPEQSGNKQPRQDDKKVKLTTVMVCKCVKYQDYETLKMLLQNYMAVCFYLVLC